MEAESDGKSAKGLYYARCDWGDLYTGTKEQLQALGLGVGLAFPGEVGGPAYDLRVRDPRGFACKISKRLSESGTFSAYLEFPGWPKRPTEERVVAYPGVKLRACWWSDEYAGKAADLIAAGLVRSDQLPGQPGMPKVRVTIFADGTMSIGGRKGVYPRSREAGAKWVQRVSSATYQVGVMVAEDEAERRRETERIATSEWEQKVRSLARPARLQPLPQAQLRHFGEACASAARDLPFQGFLARLLNGGSGRQAAA